MTVAPRDWTAHPPYIHPGYKSTVLRGPTKPLVKVPQTVSEGTGPVFGAASIGALDADLTRNGRVNGEPVGERIVVTGTVMDENARPVRGALVELWQCNATGRYVHRVDQHDAPLDPNFFGVGRCISGEDGRYRFLTIRPGAYPWGNHKNAWRPPHIHFSLFGASIVSRLITQMYFPGDPLLEFDPIYNGAPEGARERMIARFSLDATEPDFALGYVFDIVLRGPDETPME